MMSPFPYSIDIEAPLEAAAKLMQEHNIHHIPVRSEDQIVGIITERDLTLALNLSTDLPENEKISVEAAYTPEPYIVDVNTPIDFVLDEMTKRKIGSAIVMKSHKLAGIFTITDAFVKFRELLISVYGEYPEEPEAA